VARAIKDGLVKREELFIVSKLWNSFHDGDKVEPIARKQLADWGLEYFDLYLIHFPVALRWVDPAVRYPPEWSYDGKGKIELSNATIQETWTAMEGVASKGLAKSIGISNFQGSLILDLLRYAKIRPATLQIEHHPYLVQESLIKLAQAEGIAVTAYSSFGPQSFVELEWQKAKDTPLLFEHPKVVEIAKKHNKTPAQVLLRWATQRGLAVIPKSNNQGRLQQNLEVTNFDLEKSEIDAITGFDRNLRFNNPPDVSNLSSFSVSIGTGRIAADGSIVPGNSAHLRLRIGGLAVSQGVAFYETSLPCSNLPIRYIEADYGMHFDMNEMDLLASNELCLSRDVIPDTQPITPLRCF
jgi:D-xylose reductase